jgi:hypothetical protein
MAESPREMSLGEWLAVRDAMQELRVSQTYSSQLIHAGRLHAVRTRLSWLIDPESLAEFDAQRQTRRARRATRSA